MNCFGLTALLFSKSTHFWQHLFRSKIKFAPLRPFVGGAIVAIAVYLIGTTKYIGLGIPTIVDAFNVDLNRYDFLLKILFTSFTLGASFKGGEVTPLFFIGATLGNALVWFVPLPIALLAGMGFVAVFSGATNTPIACTLMGIELFGAESAVYIAIACVVAYLFSGHSGIYSSQIVGSPKLFHFNKMNIMGANLKWKEYVDLLKGNWYSTHSENLSLVNFDWNKYSDFIREDYIKIKIILSLRLSIYLLYKYLKKILKLILQGIGLSVIIIGISGAIMSENLLLLVISLVLGGIIGGLLKIEDNLDKLGISIEKKFSKGSEGGFAAGFVMASLVYCVGAMAIVGSIEAGVSGNNETLYIKAILDGISAIVFTATLGYGVIFSGISVLIYQGSIVLLGVQLESFLTDDMINEIYAVGGVLIMGIGITMLEIKKIHVGDLLPAVLIPVIWFLILSIF